MSTAPPNAEQIVDLWVERDLSQAATMNIHEMDGELEHAAGILSSGRNLLLVGESGVGKSALIGEIVRRIPTSEALRALRNARVLEFSVGLRMSRLVEDESIFVAFNALMDAIPRLDTPVVSYFRDGDLLHQCGIAARLDSFCMRQTLPIIVEGRPGAMNEMLEMHESVGQHFVTLELSEPDVERSVRIVRGLANDADSPLNGSFEDSALSEAVYLTHRFLARACLPRKAIELLRDTASTTLKATITSGEVITRFSQTHNTPRWLIDATETLALDALEERMREALLGQNDAVDAALSTITMIKSGLCDVHRPFGIHLFVGPTGVGKTHLAKLLATELFGNPQRMMRINMGDFAHPRDAQTLFGDPEHHLPANRRGVLTQRLMGHPFGVILLDEFEKAHPSVHDRLLPLIDEGCFINGAGEMISCRSSIIIATSNAGAEVYRESALGFTTPSDLGDKREELDRRLQTIFRFELLNRFDRVVHFHPLARDQIRELAARELRELGNRPGLRRFDASLQIDEAVLDWLAAHGYHARFGARFLKRTIERTVTTAIADLIARHPAEQQLQLSLDLHRGRIRARKSNEQSSPVIAGAAHAAQRPAPTTGLNASALVERATPRLDTLEGDITERDQLLTEMSQAEFWDDDERRRLVTERFRTLDVTTRLTQRFAHPLLSLRDALESGTNVTQASLETAAAALGKWEERDLHEGENSLWLVISNVDEEIVPRDRLMRLAKMYNAWCERNALRCTPVAFEPGGADLFTRLVIDVQGPGAEQFFNHERGMHCLLRKSGIPLRVRVDVLAQQSDGLGADIRDRPLIRGPFALMAQLQSTVQLPHTGQSIIFAAESRATLAALVGDLQAAWSGLRDESPEVARNYGEPGGLVRDPRTGATVSLRAAEHGCLEGFHDAFRQTPKTSGSKQ